MSTTPTTTPWQPSATLSALKQRARLTQQIRHFFETRGYLEVETPVMSQYGVTDVYLENIPVHVLGKTFYLQTSPEYHMKRLLAAGSGPIFQMFRAFRDDEHGQWHNPEFTLLEWYKLGVDHHGLIEEVDVFLQQLLSCPPLKKITYHDLFTTYCELDLTQATHVDLQAVLERFSLTGVLSDDEMDTDQILFLLMSHVIQPALRTESSPIAIIDFPVSQAALAKVQNGVAERFEVIYQGIELANGFHELTDPELQQERFLTDQASRKARGLATRDIDPHFLAALEHGLPACSGVALGVDRLMSFALGVDKVEDVLAFDVRRA